MKVRKLFLFSAMALLVIAVTSFKKPDEPKGFAVVELFTSEGCSSCPPADALIAKLKKENKDKLIYILAYHVDYWNQLGWKDAFSDASYSARQREYAHYLKAEVYTPQIVVNGKTEFVGSEEKTLYKAIDDAVKKEPTTQLAIVARLAAGNTLDVGYQVKNNGDKSSLVIALVQRSAQTNVGGGENKGRTISHVQIVRALKTVKLKKDDQFGNETINLPQGFDPRSWDVTCLVQSNVTGEIMAARTYFIYGVK